MRPLTPLTDPEFAAKPLATEFSGRVVRSNVVSPAPTRTRLWDAPGGFADQLAERFELEREAAIEHFVTEVRGLSVVERGERVLVLAAAGSLGVWLVPLAQTVGARGLRPRGGADLAGHRTDRAA